jgi:checkpoint serine/threonine-protein kinase
MSIVEDLIDFSIIETQKENIQSLPSGRSAKALASIFAPSPSNLTPSEPTLSETKTLNDAIRAEYEIELKAIGESDDPLDIYDRYVKWTLNAYPSAQATPQSQLLPLLERATKAFLSSSHYKNDPRYLKLWLHYIRFFSDTPRETFAFLARHNIGDGLALFYEEFAAWLESAGRWAQAEEVYTLGIEREARPQERLLRKFAQFRDRAERREQRGDEPSSPALPTVRPALAAKIDPWSTAASTPRASDAQGPRPSTGAGVGGTARSGRQKLEIFSDADGTSGGSQGPSTTNGWESIGSLQDRKKENTIEPKPWVGETLKVGKTAGAVQKMQIFRDEVSLSPTTFDLSYLRSQD